MSRKRLSLSKGQKHSLLCLGISIILLVVFFLLKTQLNFPSNDVDTIKLLLVLGFFSGILGALGLFYSIGIFISYTFEKYSNEKAYQKSLIDIQALSSEFSKVTLKEIQLPFFLKREDFHCTAKLDESGKVICKVELHSTFDTEDYESFLANFTINDSDAKD